MKTFVRKIILFVLILAYYSCTKSDDDFTEATIKGYDLRLCVCCGGMLVSLDSKPDDVYQWYQKSGNLNITEKNKYPLRVKIKYHFLAQTCVASAGEIEIAELIIL